jgi:hypothetical protein
MKTIKLLLLALIFVSCSGSGSNKELLTSTSWTLSPTSADSSKTTEMLKFLKDGTYILEAGDLKVNGTWSWKGDDEIYVVTQGITSDNGAANFDKTSNYNVRIKEISNKSLRILEKGEGDAWDSGFAKEKSYAAQN